MRQGSCLIAEQTGDTCACGSPVYAWARTRGYGPDEVIPPAEDDPSWHWELDCENHHTQPDEMTIDYTTRAGPPKPKPYTVRRVNGRLEDIDPA